MADPASSNSGLETLASGAVLIDGQPLASDRHSHDHHYCLHGFEPVDAMGFRVSGQVEFRDTDAAGVVYFANLLAFCHRAYEISLMESGIDLRQFFSGHPVAFPITKTSLDLLQPLFPGDRYQIELTPKLLSETTFEILYRILPTDLQELPDLPVKPIGLAQTQHVCIDPKLRQRRALPEEIQAWIQQWGDPDQSDPK